MVEVTYNQVRKAVKAINQVKQKKRNKEESLFMLEIRNSKDNHLEEEVKIQCTCTSITLLSLQ